MRRVLILSYYFPPLGMGGTQRIAGFARHLPAFGWQPHILTVKPVAYFANDPSLLAGLNAVSITRTESWDPARLLARLRRADAPAGPPSTGQNRLRRLISATMLPDSKVLWLPFAARAAQKLLREQPFDLIFSTGPPHSAHLLAARLSGKSGLPWVADLRDGWAGGNFQQGQTALHNTLDAVLEKRTLNRAAGIVCVSPGLQTLIRRRLPDPPANLVITNGFDQQDFAEKPEPDACFDLVFVGTTGNFVDSAPVLQAVRVFLQELPLSPKQFRLRFIGADLDGGLGKAVAEAGLQDYVELTGYLPHDRAVERLKRADVLLYLVTGSPSSDFVPGKTFEYLASGKPILAVCPPIDGLRLLRPSGLVRHVLPDDLMGCVNALRAFYTEFQRGITPQPERSYISRFERRRLTEQLARFFDALC